MNAKQRKKMLSRRTCVCISQEHCCETVSDFLMRILREHAKEDEKLIGLMR